MHKTVFVLLLATTFLAAAPASAKDLKASYCHHAKYFHAGVNYPHLLCHTHSIFFERKKGQSELVIKGDKANCANIVRAEAFVKTLNAYYQEIGPVLAKISQDYCPAK